MSGGGTTVPGLGGGGGSAPMDTGDGVDPPRAPPTVPTTIPILGGRGGGGDSAPMDTSDGVDPPQDPTTATPIVIVPQTATPVPTLILDPPPDPEEAGDAPASQFAWTVFEVPEDKDPFSWPPAPTTTTTTTVDTSVQAQATVQYYWKVSQRAVIPDPDPIEAYYPIQILELDGRTWNVYFALSKNVDVWRQVDTDLRQMWQRRTVPIIVAYDGRGREVTKDLTLSVSQFPKPGPQYSLWFQQLFIQGQAAAKLALPTAYPAWTKVPNQTYRERPEGPQRTDGVAFTRNGIRGGSATRTDPYVKLRADPASHRSGAASDLMTYDNTAKSRGIYASDIFISLTSLRQLVRGTYPWDTYSNTITIRAPTGKLGYVNCIDPRVRVVDFWKRAFDLGVKKMDGKAVRSRNMDGLTVLFVVCDGSQVTKDELEMVIKQARDKAVVKIKQASVVMAQKPPVLGQYDYGVYDYKLGTSPFGDYETWIRKADMISYLQCYPGYGFPATLDDAKRAFASLIPEPNAIENNRRWAESLRTQTTKLKTAGESDGKGAAVSEVSIRTVAAAGVPGARKQPGIPSQGTQMGGSATDVARSFGWPRYDARVGSFSSGGLTWDAAGVLPSEWLHRTAFSWGSKCIVGGSTPIATNQSSVNFIFGSSEANSLMTRFERSWQRLFLKERSLRLAITPTTPRPPFRGRLTTLNTYEGSTLVTLGLSTTTPPTIVRTEYEYAERAQTGKTNYWLWKDEIWQNSAKDLLFLRSLSFQLGYKLKLSGCHSTLGIPLDQMSTIFHPFQRGFFTRLEADVDLLVMDMWAKQAAIKVVSPVPPPDPQHTIPTAPTAPIAQTSGTDPTAQTLQTSQLPTTAITQLSARIIDQSSVKAVVLGSPILISSAAPSTLPHAAVWNAVTRGLTVKIAGTLLTHTAVATVNSAGQPVDLSLSNATSVSGQKTLVATLPVNAPRRLAGTVQPATTSATTIPPTGVPSNFDQTTVPNGFVFSGDMKLFKIFNERMYVYQGNASTGLRQIVRLSSNTIKISDCIPNLVGSDFDAVQLQNVELTYNEYTTGSYNAGLWIEADILFSGPLQPVSDIFRNIFRQDVPALHVEALLSRFNNWTSPFNPISFGLRGSLQGISAKFGDLVEFTEVGLALTVSRTTTQYAPYVTTHSWDVSFFGSVNLETPNEQLPMPLQFSLSEDDGVMTFTIVSGDQGTVPNVFGVPGLNLSNISLITTFGVTSGPSQLGFSASASIELRDTEIYLDGYYTKQGWGFRGEVDDLDLSSLSDLYEDLFAVSLHIPDHNVTFQDLVLVVDSSGGIILSGLVTVEGHPCVEATIIINTLGVSIQGSVADIPLAGDIELKQAALDIFIGRSSDTTVSGSGTSFRFAISGTVSFMGNDVSASLFLGKDSNANLLWTVYGGFQGNFKLSRIASPLQGTFLDLDLQQAAFIASNVDGNSVPDAGVPAGYSVVKGVQVAARVGSLGCLDSTMNNGNTPTTGITLQAVYSVDSKSFFLGLQLSAPQKVSMRNSAVSSGPVTLQIAAATPPVLILNADFFVRVPNQTDPLKFSGGFKVGVDEAELYIQMSQWWNNPFGLSPQLRIGPSIALQIGIVFGAPIYPSEMGVSGGLAIGNATGQAALSISEAPNDELIMMAVDNLSVQDLASFASSLLQISLPTPPDFLQFKKVEIYLSTGTTIGTTIYPPGASFACDAVVFGVEASVYCGVDKSQGGVTVKGTLSPIDIGPLSISGSQPGSKAEVDFTMGGVSQTLLIDGGIRVLGLDASIFVNASLLPSPTFDLQTELAFSSHLTFSLEATMRGGTLQGLTSLGSMDFDVALSFHQDILDYIVAQVNMQILASKHAVDDGISTAQNTLNKAQADYQAAVQTAQGNLNAAKAAYDSKVAQVTGALVSEQAISQVRTQQLQQAVTNANQALSSAINAANQKLQSALQTQVQAVNAAQQHVNDVKAAGDQDINNHLRSLASAQQDMQSRFGNAINSINSAQNSVNSAQGSVDSAQRDYDSVKHDYDHSAWYEKSYKWAKVAEAGSKLGVEKAALATANAALTAAKAIVQSPGYLGAQAAISAYQTGVNTAKQAADSSLSVANSTLQATITTQQGLVSSAQSALNLTKTAGTEVVNLGIAQKALQVFQTAEAGTLAALQASVNGLASAAETVAFGAATTALNVAMANSADINVAKGALTAAETGTDAIESAGAWLVAHTLNILNIQSVQVSGDLRGLVKNGTQLNAHIVGTFANSHVDFSIGFTPGQGEAFVSEIFDKLLADVKSGVLSIVQ